MGHIIHIITPNPHNAELSYRGVRIKPSREV